MTNLYAPAVLFDRIAVLVPHEPADDPRVGWVTSLCAAVARTDVISSCFHRAGPAAEFDGRVYTERFRLEPFILKRRFDWFLAADRLRNKPVVQHFMACQEAGRSRSTDAGAHRSWRRRWRDRLRYHAGGLLRLLAQYGAYRRGIADPFWLRVRGLAAPPRLVICEDFGALAAGIRLKRLYGCRVIYDAHEFTPEADMFAHPLESWHWRRLERRLARQADALVTVTPQIADEFRRLYRLKAVLCVPNATPLVRQLPARPAAGLPVRFLLQGGASAGRGFEVLLSAWRELADPRAVLYIRCPENAYLRGVRTAHEDLVARGLVQFLPAVASTELTEAAAFADVGIIPYPVKVGNRERNRNHLYCCPNKLSQYMQAGLALLSTNSVYVSQALQRYGCGLTYDAEQPASLVRAVRALVDDLPGLRQMQANARHWSRTEFNWDVQAKALRELIADLYHGSATARAA